MVRHDEFAGGCAAAPVTHGFTHESHHYYYYYYYYYYCCYYYYYYYYYFCEVLQIITVPRP